MRLHTLRMTAVGPFADEQTIDFDRLGAGGLFLFEGPTGVGKSTILDALTFALYGGLASESGDPARMRSDFADPTARPEVVLEFSVRGQRHRVTRSPEFRRPKLRGSGTTVEKASVHLERLEHGRWASRSHSKEETGTIIGDLVGLNRDQFRQVVLLPQGEFATFLRADDDKRREVLGRLFGTHFYRHVTDSLQARATAARSRLAEVRSHLSARVAAAWEAAGRDAGADDGSPRPLTEQVDQVMGLAEVLADAETSTSESAAAAERVAAELGTRTDAAREVAELLERRGRLQAAVAAAMADLPAAEQRRARAQQGRRAASVRPLLDLVRSADEQLRARQSRALGVGVPEAELAAGSAQEHVTAARDLRARAEGLGHLVAEEQSLPGLRADIAAADGRRSELRVRCDRLAGRRDALPDALRSARSALAQAHAAQGQVTIARTRLEALTAQRAAAGRAAELAGRLESAREARRAARREYEEARDHVDLLREHRLSDMRGELASQLVSGEACLVCGSLDHPAPARLGGTGVTDPQVRAAVTRRDDCEVAREQAESALARAESALAAARSESGDRTTAELDELIGSARGELEEAERLVATQGDLSDRVEALATEQEQVLAELLRLGGEVARLGEVVDRGRTDVEGLESRLREARDGWPTVAARIADLVTRADREQAIGDALADLRLAERTVREARNRAAAESSSAGFASLGEAESAAMDPAELDALERQVSQWQAALDAARAQLASSEMARVADVDADEVAAEVRRLDGELARARGRAAEAREQAALAAERARRFGARLEEVRTAAQAHADAAAETEQLVALDQYARGLAGTPRMSLVTYVLRYWFEQVVAAANLRLAAMSAGKYQLLRTDQAARKDARVGLGLAVLDRHTGCERSPGTLSGGETFYTSLSLALGLADVVVAQAGGAQLDTLFIDEGFGSLDPDTLDDVMAVIDELRGNGRAVGIVSHVPDLKERVTERLSVRRSRPDGPSVVEVHA